jgi:hypothetical protein
LHRAGNKGMTPSRDGINTSFMTGNPNQSMFGFYAARTVAPATIRAAAIGICLASFMGSHSPVL